MKKWKKVTIWVVSILIVLVVGGLFAANYAVDKVLDSMIGMSVDDLLEEDTEVPTTPDEVDTILPSESNNQVGGIDSSDQPDSTEQQENSKSADQDSDSTAPNSPEKPTATTKPEASKSPESEGNNNSDSGYTAEISTDKAKEVEKNITVTEKAKVVTTLMSSLSASDISTLQKLASGGMSQEEKKQARDIMLEKLSEDQYNELIAIAAKHGLSQGKSYSEVKAE